MTSIAGTVAGDIAGNAAAQAAFAAASAGGHLHHAWLLAGPEGVGKASFARQAARALLVATGGAQAATLFDAGSHPDYHVIERLPREPHPDKADKGLARSIVVDQVRAMRTRLNTRPSLGRRVIVIDTADDLERPGASNALLKSLEEPPIGTTFLLVSHAPGRLLPTIRSRCRLLRFEPLDDAAMHEALAVALPKAGTAEVEELVRVGQGSPGRALGFAGLAVAEIDRALARIAQTGDPTNQMRVALAALLAVKAAQPRYEALLDRAPGFVARIAEARTGDALRVALDTYDAVRSVAASARALSLDTQATVFEIGTLVARLAVR